MRCPNCRQEDTLREWEGTTERLGVELEARGLRCSSCGEMVFESEEAKRQGQALVEALVERGVRKGNELALVRKAAGLRSAEVERGDAEQAEDAVEGGGSGARVRDAGLAQLPAVLESRLATSGESR